MSVSARFAVMAMMSALGVLMSTLMAAVVKVKETAEESTTVMSA